VDEIHFLGCLSWQGAGESEKETKQRGVQRRKPAALVAGCGVERVRRIPKRMKAINDDGACYVPLYLRGRYVSIYNMPYKHGAGVASSRKRSHARSRRENSTSYVKSKAMVAKLRC